MSNNTIQFAAIIDGVTKKKDGTLSVKLGTQELGPQDTAQIFEYGNQQIWIAFKDEPIESHELIVPKDFVPEFPGEKSPSKRLKDVLYVYWKQLSEIGKITKSSDQFYRDQMEKITNHIKDKLE